MSSGMGPGDLPKNQLIRIAVELHMRHNYMIPPDMDTWSKKKLVEVVREMKGEYTGWGSWGHFGKRVWDDYVITYMQGKSNPCFSYGRDTMTSVSVSAWKMYIEMYGKKLYPNYAQKGQLK